MAFTPSKDYKRREREQRKMDKRREREEAKNEKLAAEKVEAELLRHSRYHHSLSLLSIDIDYFRQVNERFGHAAGDRTLIRVVAIIEEVMRDTDCLFRSGDEEFSIVAPETDIEGGDGLAKRIMKALREEEFDLIQTLTASMGVTEMVEGDDLALVIKRLDEALGEAKNEGRNRIVVRSI